GVEPERAADAKASLEQGRIVEAERIDTVADGLRVKRIGSLNFEILRKYLDEVVTVTEEEILAAVGTLAERAKLVVEPSGAVTLAAVVNGKVRSTGPTAVILSGGNVDKQLLAQVLTS
ncbi:MAG: pyridoxal-phosphate dependent enzyme, partial [Chloroflexi bacterium]|nr:pyridoxal-phosphate dependent enzyme [Chloroflexota bacterium]